jgi:hypothetical protein
MNKTTKILCALCVTACLFSCRPTKILTYYQVFKATPTEEMKENGHFMVFEDKNCQVTYNFWESGGNAGFALYNKSNENIYVHLSKCFFVRNGIAYDYFKNREYSSTTGSSHSIGYSATVTSGYSTTNAIGYSNKISSAAGGYSNVGGAVGVSAPGMSIVSGGSTGVNYNVGTSSQQTSFSNQNSSMNVSKSTNESVTKISSITESFKEKEIVCIPPHSAKVVSEYLIWPSLYRDCDLFIYPKKGQKKTKEFSASDSPVVFSNVISYTLGERETPYTIENNFFVSEITNFSKNEIIVSNTEKDCDNTSRQISYIEYYPGEFYIQYTGTNRSKLKH